MRDDASDSNAAPPQMSRKRRKIIERDKSTCYLCGRVLALEEITLDHVIPRRRGGNNRRSNLKVACDDCNTRKGDRLLCELDWILELIKLAARSQAWLDAQQQKGEAIE